MVVILSSLTALVVGLLTLVKSASTAVSKIATQWKWYNNLSKTKFNFQIIRQQLSSTKFPQITPFDMQVIYVTMVTIRSVQLFSLDISNQRWNWVGPRKFTQCNETPILSGRKHGVSCTVYLHNMFIPDSSIIVEAA